MEEEKANAYYDEMLRKGGGAARLKHGLGYGGHPSSGSLPTFVKADSHLDSPPEPEKDSVIDVVREKLKKQDYVGGDKSAWRRGDRGERHEIRRHRSPGQCNDDSGFGKSSSWRNSSDSDKRSSSSSQSKKSRTSHRTNSIPGYDGMTPAEKVKARMKIQLKEIVAKDSLNGVSTEWERFDFNKDAPLDDDSKLDDIGDGANVFDDTRFLQNTGSTFSSSTSQARKEAQIQENHDMAMFGPPSNKPGRQKKSNDYANLALEKSDGVHKEENSSNISSLISDQVLNMQQGSWRQRALKLKQQKSANSTA